MKLTQKISAVIILMVMIASLVPTSVFAGFFENGILPSPVILKDSFGRPIETLTPDTEIYAETTVRNFNGRLILAYYERNVLKEINSEPANIGQQPDVVRASITTGSDVSEARLQAFLWDGYSSSEILSKKADFSSGLCTISGIYLDGALISGFDREIHEYNCNLPVGSYEYPSIYVETEDLSTKVDISYESFPGTATINLESADKRNSDTYKINFTRETGEISNISMRTPDKILTFPSSIVLDSIAAPVFKSGSGAITSPDTAGYYDTPNLVSWTSVFSDTNAYLNNYFLSLPDILSDASYIRLERELRNPRTLENPNANPTATDALYFDINASADVYYVFMGSNIASQKDEYAPWLDEYGWVDTGETLQFVESNGVSASTKPAAKGILKKSFRAAPGETTRVNIGGFNLNWFVPVVFVDFIENNKNAFLSSVKADGAVIEEFDNGTNEYKFVLEVNETPPAAITAEADVEGATVTVDKTVNDEVTEFTVRVVSVDNTVSNTFKFIYTQKQPEVTNASFKVYDGTAVTERSIAASNIVTGFTEPVFKTGAVTDISAWNYYSTSNLDSWHSVFSNSNYLMNNYFFSVPDEMKDAVYIRCDRGWREPRTNANTPNAMRTQSEVLTFDINTTADVYYVIPGNVSNATWLTDESWTDTGETALMVESSGASDTSSVPPRTHSYSVYKKRFEVVQDETVKVKIGGYYQSYYVPFVFVSWVEE